MFAAIIIICIVFNVVTRIVERIRRHMLRWQIGGAAHLLKGCKAIYVLADSPYQCYEDLKGQAISVPNGIGASDYNITARLLIECGLITATDDADAVIESLWHPLGSAE